MRRLRSKKQFPVNLTTTPLLIVISGPSGAGKDAVLTRMKETGLPLEYITTVTTRPRRPEERDRIDYRFVSVEQFQKMLESGELLESAKVYDNWYGIPKQPAKQALDRGQDVIVKVDVQGAATIRRILPQAVFIFITSSSLQELAQRLGQRHNEAAFDLELRLKTAEEEIKQLPLFDYVVINKQGEIDLAVSQIQAIITAEKCRVIPREIRL